MSMIVVVIRSRDPAGAEAVLVAVMGFGLAVLLAAMTWHTWRNGDGEASDRRRRDLGDAGMLPMTVAMFAASIRFLARGGSDLVGGDIAIAADTVAS